MNLNLVVDIVILKRMLIAKHRIKLIHAALVFLSSFKLLDKGRKKRTNLSKTSST